MVTPVDPTAAAFLFAENRKMPMHVGALQLFDRPEGAGDDYVRSMFDQMRHIDHLRPLFLQHPVRSVRTAGQYVWEPDDEFDIDHHVRHSALPRPGRIRELLELCSRLHGTPLARERPLWEAHVIEGLDDGRVALYTKTHHALVDGMSAMRLLAGVLSGDPDERDMAAPWEVPHPGQRKAKKRSGGSREDDGPHGRPAELVRLVDMPGQVVRQTMSTALAISAEAAGMPVALAKTMVHGIRNQTSAVSLYAPRTLFNTDITGSRRFAAQDWSIDRLKAIASASGTTLNDVVLAMCAGAMRTYLHEMDALPDAPMVAMVPISLKAKSARAASAGDGGNAVGAVMCQLATDRADPADRLSRIHASMVDGKQAFETMTPAQVIAMTALGQAPAVLGPMLGLQRIVRPPYNLIISNVPGPKTTQWWNGAKMSGLYPLSIPINGMGLNITCTSYDGRLGFGLTGCRRTVPHLQRLLTHLDDEVAALEKAVGVA